MTTELEPIMKVFIMCSTVHEKDKQLDCDTLHERHPK